MAGLSSGREINVPAGSMVVLVGPSGSGKSTFAARHFLPTQVLSSDHMRSVIADDPGDQAATDAAFELLHTALGLRLARRRTTVVDATNVERWARGRLLAIARRLGRPAIAIVLALPVDVCLTRNELRDDRRPPGSVRRQHRAMTGSMSALAAEGFAAVHVLRSPDEIEATTVALSP